MWGAVIGDMAGSIYEGRKPKMPNFPILIDEWSRFTDDTVLTVAVAQALLTGGSYQDEIHRWGRRYPNSGYGFRFQQWLKSDKPEPYGSFGNGSAMRVSPIGLLGKSVDWVLQEAEKSAAVTHNHPEGIKEAQAVALAVFMAKNGASKTEIRDEIVRRFNYDLLRHYEDIKAGYSFDVSCQGSVPESIISFLMSENYEDAVRKAIWLKGDADTMACIAGAIAEAYYGAIPQCFLDFARLNVPEEFAVVLDKLYQRDNLEF